MSDDEFVSLEGAEHLELEQVHGRYETVTMTSEHFIVLNQVRGIRNAILDDLKESVERRVHSGKKSGGLINQFDVVRLAEDQLIEYIEFTNSLWGSKITMEDLAHGKQSDGSYYLVSSGHTRLQAIRELEQEGRIPKLPIDAKIHEIESVHEFLQLQIDENLHSTPPKERRAMAIVESFYWGREKGLWSNQKEYLEMNSDVTSSTLSEALQFSHLPENIRKFVFSQKLPYNAGISLGKAAKTYEEYIYFKSGIVRGEETPEELELIAENLKIDLTIEADNIAEAKMSGARAELRIKNSVAILRAEMEAASTPVERPKDEVALIEIEDLSLYDPVDLLRQDLALKKTKLNGMVKKFGSTPGTWAKEMIELHDDIVDPEVYARTLTDFQKSAEQVSKVLGVSALKETATSFSSLR